MVNVIAGALALKKPRSSKKATFTEEFCRSLFSGELEGPEVGGNTEIELPPQWLSGEGDQVTQSPGSYLQEPLLFFQYLSPEPPLIPSKTFASSLRSVQTPLPPATIYLFLFLHEGRAEPGDGAEWGPPELTRWQVS